MRLQGKTAVVTGGGQGIGFATALTLAKEGCDVAVYDINLSLANGTAKEIKSSGREALAVRCDVSNSGEVHDATRNVIEHFGKIDILVNNAGIVIPAAAAEITEEAWDRTININLKGQFLCCQSIGRQMIKQNYGKIINIASTLAHVATPHLVAYAASKGGVLQLTKVLAVEWAKYNINVNAVSPGMTETPMMAGAGEKEASLSIERRLKRIPLRRQNKPEDIAKAVLFLASSESDNITGQAIIVDAGVCALHSGYMWPGE
jgi:NAD(P)-dependent dehydrogenase (short-subunit alcohol dehydrogenase family)